MESTFGQFLKRWRRTVGTAGFTVASGVGVLVLYFLAPGRWADIVLFVGGPAVGYSFAALQSSFIREQEARQIELAATSAEALVKESQDDLSINVGRLEIPNGALVVASGYRQPYTDRTRFRFEREFLDSRPDPPEWDHIKHVRIPAFQERARNEGRTFTDDPKLDLRSIVVDRAGERRAANPTLYTLGVSVSNYYRFAGMSNALDLPFENSPSGETLREIWNFHPRAISALKDAPSPACIGIVVVVVTTQDQMIVCHERGAVYQVGAQSDKDRAIHFVGEGMLPDDRLPNGELSPVAGAMRGLGEELGVVERVDSDLELIATGVYLDTKRWQPVFCYLALVDDTFEKLRAYDAPRAKDGWEYRELHARRFTISDPRTRDLLLGTDARFRLASNHAQVALFLALLQADDFETIAENISARR